MEDVQAEFDNVSTRKKSHVSRDLDLRYEPVVGKSVTNVKEHTFVS
jgi:hypothetical protein